MILLISIILSATPLEKFNKIIQKHKDDCNKSNALDCEQLGVLNELGKGVPKNLENAMKLYTKACDLNSSYGCYHIGRMYDHGLGVKKDSKKALDIYTKGCDQKHGISCFSLGDMYDKGEGVKKDSKKSVELYSKACDNNYPRACFNLGNAYATGTGVKEDKAKAVNLYKKACSGGDRYGCRNYQILTRASNPISKEGTWEDDPKNWQRVFGQGHSDRLKEIHSYYWRSAHWTLEYEYFFELALNKADSEDWIGNIKEIKGKECLSMMDGSFIKKPKWFLSDKKSSYRCFVAPKGRGNIFFHKKSGHFFMTDSMI